MTTYASKRSMIGPPAGMRQERQPQKATFVGRNSKTADLEALKRAERKEQEGVPREQIWKDEGWFRGADGEWRAEVSDHEARLKVAPGQSLPPDAKMRDFLDHTKLYDAIPELADMPVQFQDLGPMHHGYYDGPNGVVLNPHSQDQRALLKTGVHEAGHAAGARSGFSSQSIDPQAALESDSEVLTKIFDLPSDPYELYRMTSNEEDARATTRRMGLDEKQRRENPPWFDYDTPMERQITNSNAIYAGAWPDKDWEKFEGWWTDLDQSGASVGDFQKKNPAPTPMTPFDPVNAWWRAAAMKRPGRWGSR